MAGTAALTTVVLWNAASRYLLDNPLGWADEVSRVSLVWLGYAGGYVALRQQEHIALRLIPRLPPRGERMVVLVGKTLMSVVCLVTALWGIDYVSSAGGRSTPVTDIPLSVAYAAIPVAFSIYLVAIWAPPLVRPAGE